MTLHREGPDWRGGFLFVADQPAVDFVNTRLDAGDGLLELLPDWPALVGWFLAAGLISEPAARRLVADRADTAERCEAVRDLTCFRDALHTAVSRIAAGEAAGRTFIAQVNRHLRAHPIRLQLTRHGRRMRREPLLDAARPADLIAPLADAAAGLLVDVDPSRVRKCDGCGAYFCDASKNGRRRWCSMRICGNRTKVGRYAERRRGRRLATPSPSRLAG